MVTNHYWEPNKPMVTILHLSPTGRWPRGGVVGTHSMTSPCWIVDWEPSKSFESLGRALRHVGRNREGGPTRGRQHPVGVLEGLTEWHLVVDWWVFVDGGLTFN